jgi:hypothetical protein
MIHRTVCLLVVSSFIWSGFASADEKSAPAIAKMPAIKGVTLPPQRPLLNAPSRYAIGNGVCALVAGPDGSLQASFGPGYTTSDLGKHEDFFLNVDGTETPLHVDMKRAAKTGVYYGAASLGDLDVGIVDYAVRGEPSISRLILFKNHSATSHTISVRDHITPCTGKGYKNNLALDASGDATGFAIHADTSIGVPYCGTNPMNQTEVIAFNDSASTAATDGDGASLKSKPVVLAPGAQQELALTHYFHRGDDLTDAKAIENLRAIDPHQTLQKSIAEWTGWIDHVAPAYSLSRIKDPRARVLVEGALTVLKTNQSVDGGIVAHTTFYKSGFVRDAAMAIRGLLATGHTEEAKQWLVWVDKKLSVDGHIADSMSCLVSLDDKSSHGDLGNMEVEEPGWILLVARDYYRQTHDLAALKKIDRTLRWCTDVQLKQAAGHDDKLPFNGDETEVCTAVDIAATGSINGSDTATKEWSLSSVAMAAASIDFMAKYVKATGGDPANYHNGQTNTTTDLNAEVKKFVAAMDRDFWRTDVPESPAGFHDWFRNMADNAWPKARLVNFTLMPAFFGTPYAEDEKIKDVAAIAPLFDEKTGFLPLVPGSGTGMEGHDLGYLLWGCVDTGDWRKHAVYRALVNGPTVDAWGAFTEAYDAQGHPNGHDLRSLETGINVTALAKYWGLGK